MRRSDLPDPGPNLTIDERYRLSLKVLQSASCPMRAKDICRQYLDRPATDSDALTTGQILTVLSLAGMVNRIEMYEGKRKLVFFELRRSNR